MSSNFWFVDQEGNQSGPVERDEIIRRIKNGTITRESMLWTEGMDAWCEAHKVEGLAAAFAPTPPPPSRPLPAAIHALNRGNTTGVTARRERQSRYARIALFAVPIAVAILGVAYYFVSKARNEAEIAEAKTSVCQPGRIVSPIRVTEFVSKEPGLRPDTITNVGDELTVKARDGDRCLVNICVRDTCHDASVRAADLGTVQAARAIIAGRGINRIADVTQATFSQSVRDDLARRAETNVGPSQYDEQDLDALAALVRSCAAITQEQVVQAHQQIRNQDRRGADFLNQYASCTKNATAPVGCVQPSGAVVKPKRNLTVCISLRSAERPYKVMLVFARDESEDKNVKLSNTASIGEALSSYFEAYGVGNYRFQP
jgi:hypothetical protein